MNHSEAMRRFVRERLDQWGLEYALDRDYTGTGYASQNVLHKMMKHGMIARGVSHDVADDAQQIELIVTDIARLDMRVACCLRGYFCGSMRRKVERFEKALELATKHKIRRFSLRTYLNDVAMGEALVRVALIRREKLRG